MVVSIELGKLWLEEKGVQGLEIEVAVSFITPGKKTPSRVKGEDD